MAKIALVNMTLKDAAVVKALWESIPDFKAGSISLDEFLTANDAAEALAKEYTSKDAELSAIKERRDDKALALNTIVKRFRLAVRLMFGEDSAEYSLAGGTRTRHRKSPKAKAETAA